MITFKDISKKTGTHKIIRSYGAINNSKWYVFNIEMLHKTVDEPVAFVEFDGFDDAYDYFKGRMSIFKCAKSNDCLNNFRLADGSEILDVYFTSI